MSKQIFVVEGKNDVAKLRNIFPNIDVVSINGLEIDENVISYLKKISSTHEIILCMDPDYPGKKIRTRLEQEIKNVSHVFLDRKSAISKNKRKIGLEHIDDKILIQELKKVVKFTDLKGTLEMSDLYELGLIGFDNSKELRLELTKYLEIDNCNGKRLLNRLNNLNINKDELINIIPKLL